MKEDKILEKENNYVWKPKHRHTLKMNELFFRRPQWQHQYQHLGDDKGETKHFR